VIKKLKLILFILFLIYQTSAFSKTSDESDFNLKYLSSYLSAIISQNNQESDVAIKYFNSSKILINKHEKYLKDYIFALVLNNQVKKAINQIGLKKNQDNSNFFEADILLLIDNFKKKKFKRNISLLSDLERNRSYDNNQWIIYEVLKSYNDLFLKKELNSNKKNIKFWSTMTVGKINEAFEYCYLNRSETSAKLINIKDNFSTRYLFFYLNNLINKKDFETAIKTTREINDLNSDLLSQQSKLWINNSNFEKFEKIFSCKNETDILAEFFFIISNYYSSTYFSQEEEMYLPNKYDLYLDMGGKKNFIDWLEDQDGFHVREYKRYIILGGNMNYRHWYQQIYRKLNFYSRISYYLNPKFYFNSTNLISNYYEINNYEKMRNLLENFNKEDEIYYWYKFKKISQIIYNEQNSKQSLNYIETKFNEYSNPSIKIIYDMANIYKRSKEFEKSIKYYSLVLEKLNENSDEYADVLYKRGTSYERVGDDKNSDKDLLKSLSIKPDDPYVLNYLGYSWLERNFKIQEAISMLDKAYNQKKNNPFIIDSVGWGYYLIGDFVNAENFLRKAIQLMPEDPIVNDHYGDVLWKLNRKIQAKYYWQSALNSEDSENEMKTNISKKLLKGLDED